MDDLENLTLKLMTWSSGYDATKLFNSEVESQHMAYDCVLLAQYCQSCLRPRQIDKLHRHQQRDSCHPLLGKSSQMKALTSNRLVRAWKKIQSASHTSGHMTEGVENHSRSNDGVEADQKYLQASSRRPGTGAKDGREDPVAQLSRNIKYSLGYP